MNEKTEQEKPGQIKESGIGALPYLVIKITGTKNETPNLVSSGTGFFYLLEFGDYNVPMIVTNKHVVDHLDVLTFHFALKSDDGRRTLGQPELVTLNTAGFPIARHPDPDVDLVAIPANPLLDAIRKKGKVPFYMHLGNSHLPPAWLRERLIASTQVLMVGFPNGLMDVANNLPLTRKGILATPYQADYNGRPDFVVDIAAFGGSSGSPVFAHFDALVPGKDGSMGLGGSAVHLIGVLHSGPMISAVGDVIPVPIPTSKQVAHTSLMMHLGYCLRAELIEDFISLVRPMVEKERAETTESQGT